MLCLNTLVIATSFICIVESLIRATGILVVMFCFTRRSRPRPGSVSYVNRSKSKPCSLRIAILMLSLLRRSDKVRRNDCVLKQSGVETCDSTRSSAKHKHLYALLKAQY